jgi:outer membrane receptor for ferrienterochelin and colicins
MRNLFLIFIIFSPYMLYSQIEGYVYGAIDGKDKVPLYAADVFFKKSGKGKTTCDQGRFLFELPPKLPDTLIIRAMGYHPDTIPISKLDKDLYLEITLFPTSELDEVVIKRKRDNSMFLRLDARNTEVLNAGELRKAACCNLSESFETNATVDVNMNDGVSGTKRISMMGLDGAYTQIQFENFPILKNLALASGLNSIPGTWINSIQITKGTGTVVNGYESMVGLINLEYHKPDDMERFYFNAYASNQGRGEVNIHSGNQINEKWSTGVFAHVSTAQFEMDRNNDGFRDIPIGEEYVFMNRWKYQGKNNISQFGVKANHSEKIGGTIGFDPRGATQDNYGVTIRNNKVELFGKNGWTFEDHPYRTFGMIYYAKYQELSAIYGRRNLQAEEYRGYLNLLYEDILGSTIHGIKAGASLVFDDLNQTLLDNIPAGVIQNDLIRTEIVPGVYSEYTYTGLRTTIVAGGRLDYHNLFGWQGTPRFNIKYRLNEDMDLRATIGRGFRVQNYAVDHLSLMATNIPWIIQNDLLPETSWNAGMSWYYEFKIANKKASFNIDYFHTYFTNQLIADRDEDPSVIIFKNLSGVSFSNVVQADFRIEPLRGLEIKTAYKFLDVRATMGGMLMEQMMIPRHRGFINAGYITRNKRWEFDITGSVFGRQRLAPVVLPDMSVSQDNTSGIMHNVNAQITHVFKRFDFYLGGENITDFRLMDPIIDVQNPFGQHFDATRVWAPIVGINVYAGIRIKLD